MRAFISSRVVVALCVVSAAATARAQEDDRAAERARLVQELVTGTGSLPRASSAPPPSLPRWGPGPSMPMASSRAVSDALALRNPKVIDALRAVPRHWFVPSNMQREAYANRPLPIGYGQTISQPFIVGMMTELLDPKPGSKVLEVGTGSGYQAAILTRFTPNVYTVEIVEPLYRDALPRLQKFGLDPAHVIKGDGYFGLPQEAPFDSIIVTAAADHIPPPLIQQLRPGGRMVIPIGAVHATQRLVVVEKDVGGKVRSQAVHPVKFVPLVGGPGAAGAKK